MSKLFGVQRAAITKHINNIYKSKELDIITTSSKMEHMGGLGLQKYQVNIYNLDIIISVGYRVNSKRGITFKRWANNVLKKYIIKGHVVNTERIVNYKENYLSFTSTVKMISSFVERRELTLDESKSLLNIINKYSYALDTLDKYDHNELTISDITKDINDVKLDYDKAIKEIKSLKDYKNN